MVMARLHVICGNCGNGDKDLFEWEHKQKTADELETVYVRCLNCVTLHDINDNAQNKAENNREGV
jgi:DNA-directed RNA polymerase subunit M/transcription elongation factor TFIIS